MAYEIELDIRVVPELSEIVTWYAAKSISTAEKFETAFSWVMESLNTGIIEYASFTGEIKRAPIPGFPYIVYYSRNEEIKSVFIHAVLHTKRGPDFILKRLYE
jgi:plasmid stabilization system protein ParE